MLLPLLLLPAGLELILRVSGYGYDPRFLTERDGQLVDNYRFSWSYFPSSMARTQQPLRIEREKAGRIRIVVYGESAAMGDPEPAIGLPRMLEVILEQRYPDRKFEVINAAMTAINSWTIADIASDMADVPADLSVVYLGNNEVVGPFGAGTVFGGQAPAPWWVRTQLAVRRTRIGQWIKARGEAQAGAATWQGMEMFLKNQVPADAPALARVQSSFQENVRRIAERLSAEGRPVLIAAAAVNLRDCPPFGSVRKNSAAPIPADADLAALEAAWQADPGCAETAWRLGRARMQAGDAAGATPLFRTARDLDTLRFRCDSTMQAAVSTSVSGLKGVTVLDMQKLLDSAGGGSAGDDYFHEHVHLTPRGGWEVAGRFADAAATVLGLPPATIAPADLDACLQRLVFTPWHEVRLLEEMRDRLRKAPFTAQHGHAERFAALEQRIAAARTKLSPAAMRQWGEDAMKVCTAHPDDWRAAMQAALLLEAAGNQEAISLLASAARTMPHQSVFQQHGATLNRFKRYAEAEPVLRRALEMRPEFPAAWNSLGVSLSHLNRIPEAREAFQKAVALSPDYADARRALAAVLLQQKNSAGAEAQLAAIIAANANDAAAHYQLGQILTGSGRMAAAVPHYDAVARLLPRDAAAQINAGGLQLKLGNSEEAARFLRRALEIDPQNADAARLLSTIPAAPAKP